MKKKKIITGTVLFLITFLSGIITLVLYPQPLFANELEYKNFNIYSNTEISTGFKVVLNNANTIVMRSELYDSSYNYDIFLCYNSLYNRIDDRLLGKGPAARAIDNNLVIKIQIDPERNVGFPSFITPCEVDLTYLIAHEMVHCLQAKKYGKIKFNPFRHPEMWKLEGYPEYVSKQMNKTNAYDLINEIDRYIYLLGKSNDGLLVPGNGKCVVPEIYYKSGLMMKFEMDIEKLSYDKILKDTVSENRIYNEMIQWKENIQRMNNQPLKQTNR